MLNTAPCGPREVLILLEEMYELRMPVFLWGKPGIGKSQIVHHFVTKHDMHLVDLRLTTLESVDLRGLPRVDNELKQTIWMRPEFFPVEDKPTVIFLDELTAAEPRIQASSYQLILDRRIGSHVLPPSAWVVGAGNGLDDGSISYGMGDALADRFMHVNVVANAQDWITWSLDNNIHPAVTTFIRMKPECLDSSQGVDNTEQLVRPSPRSWERVSHVLHKTSGKTAKSLAVNGLVGEGVATQFFHTMDEIGQVPPFDVLLKMRPKDAARAVPKTLAALYGFTYGAVAYVKQIEEMEWVIRVQDALTEIQDENPRAEIQTLGMELLLAKAASLKVMSRLAESQAYRSVYQAKSREIVN